MRNTMATTADDALLAIPTLPAKIHFVWVGGPIPEKYLHSIRRLAIAAAKSGIEVNLWTNSQANYEKTAEKLDLPMPDNFRIRDIQELKEGMGKDELYQSDERFERFWNYVNREMVGLKNLAAASDILRYEILRQEGGYYFDTDTEFELDEKSVLTIDPLEHGFKKIGSLLQDKLHDMFDGNDIIAAVPNHPAIQQVLLNVLENYKQLDINAGPAGQRLATGMRDAKGSMDEKRSLQDEQFFGRRPLTARASGPAILRKVVAQYAATLPDQHIENKRKLFFSTADSDRSAFGIQVLGVLVRSHSAQSWLQRSTPSSFDDASTFFSTRQERKQSGDGVKPQLAPSSDRKHSR